MPHVLVFDDEPDIRWLMAHELSGDFNVLQGQWGGDLQRLAHCGEPLAVISDLHMGVGPSGAEVLDEVARRWPRAARIIVSGTGAAHALVAVGIADRFIPKPWVRGALLGAVKEILAGSRERVS